MIFLLVLAVDIFDLNGDGHYILAMSCKIPADFVG